MGGELVWGALGTEVVGVGMSSVMAFVGCRDNSREQLPLLSRQPRGAEHDHPIQLHRPLQDAGAQAHRLDDVVDLVRPLDRSLVLLGEQAGRVRRLYQPQVGHVLIVSQLKSLRPPADSCHVDVQPGQAAPRRIGTILVERRLITDAQLELALKEQEATGRPLGEICVERFGLDRLSLADALAEQWQEMQAVTPTTAVFAAPSPRQSDSDGESNADLPPEEELRMLLEEAEAARAELASRTDELGRRLAVLETLVVSVSDALRELRTLGPDRRDHESSGSNGAATTTTRPKQGRSSTRTASPGATSS